MERQLDRNSHVIGSTCGDYISATHCSHHRMLVKHMSNNIAGSELKISFSSLSVKNFVGNRIYSNAIDDSVVAQIVPRNL